MLHISPRKTRHIPYSSIPRRSLKGAHKKKLAITRRTPPPHATSYPKTVTIRRTFALHRPLPTNIASDQRTPKAQVPPTTDTATNYLLQLLRRRPSQIEGTIGKPHKTLIGLPQDWPPSTPPTDWRTPTDRRPHNPNHHRTLPPIAAPPRNDARLMHRTRPTQDSQLTAVHTTTKDALSDATPP